MNILVVTQTLDLKDPVLGFFHAWVLELAERFEHVEVICLKEGVHALPSNVHVHSLGKEKKKQMSAMYAFRFLLLSWKLRGRYHKVFVHMNQEYLLIAGVLWKTLGKHVYLWRNHYAGSWLTDTAVFLCSKVFYTSKRSYTAKYPKAVQMPVGVDTAVFRRTETPPKSHSVLYFGRVALSKKPEVLIDALARLHEQSISFTASFFGAPLPADEHYYQEIKARARSADLRDMVTFFGGVSHTDAPAIFSAHEVYVNTSPQGMFDKTIIEACASGCLVVTCNDDMALALPEKCIFKEGDAESLAGTLQELFLLTEQEREALIQTSVRFSEKHSLKNLAQTLTTEMQ